jgi:hypothetical protein
MVVIVGGSYYGKNCIFISPPIKKEEGIERMPLQNVSNVKKIRHSSVYFAKGLKVHFRHTACIFAITFGTDSVFMVAPLLWLP